MIKSILFLQLFQNGEAIYYHLTTKAHMSPMLVPLAEGGDKSRIFCPCYKMTDLYFINSQQRHA